MCYKFILKIVSTILLSIFIFVLTSPIFSFYEEFCLYVNTIDKELKFNLIIEIVKTFISLLTTLATSWGGFVVYRNFQLGNKNLQELKNKNLNDAELAKLRLASERFSKATEQLASDKLPVRLGAIYSLENIGKEHDEYHWIVIQILSDFIREKKDDKNTVQDKLDKPLIIIIPNQTKEQNEENKDDLDEFAISYTSKISLDAQTALTVIGKRNVSRDLGKINLSGANLKGAFLDDKADFSEANFSKSDLSHSFMHGNFKKAIFNEAFIYSANFSKANLEGAEFNEADLRKIFMKDANLRKAILNNSFLTGAILEKVNFHGAYLIHSHFSLSDLKNIDFSSADLSKANLAGSILDTVDFLGANLRKINLSEAQLTNTRFVSVDLTDARLTGANLSIDELEDSTLCRTIMPNGRAYKSEDNIA